MAGYFIEAADIERDELVAEVNRLLDNKLVLSQGNLVRLIVSLEKQLIAL